MVNGTALKELIKNKGIKNKFIAEKLGIAPNSLSRKISGKSDFKLSEMEIVCNVLSIDEQTRKNIFFA